MAFLFITVATNKPKKKKKFTVFEVNVAYGQGVHSDFQNFALTISTNIKELVFLEIVSQGEFPNIIVPLVYRLPVMFHPGSVTSRTEWNGKN